MKFLSVSAFLTAVTALFLITALFSPADAAQPGARKYWVYVGAYNTKTNKGIYRFDFDSATGKLTSGELAAESVNPSFLAIHPSRKFLYAVGETSGIGKSKGGVVRAFSIDPKTGNLTFLNEQSSGGAGPCHLVVDKAGKNVLVANYGSGSVEALPLAADGKLREAAAVVQHEGKSTDPSRQEGPHAHSINLDAGNRFAFAADLGLDKVLVYRFDVSKGWLEPNDPPYASVAPGSGPRHFAFHPNGHNAYVINEIRNTLTAFHYDPQSGSLKEIQTISTLPSDFKGKSYTAEVQVHPSGKYVFGSNRGHDSIAVFRVEESSGKLTLVGHQAKGIKTPRNFGQDPQGKYVLVANQDSDSIVVFRFDAETGELNPTGVTAEVGMPVCVKMMPIPR